MDREKVEEKELIPKGITQEESIPEVESFDWEYDEEILE
jgi:hypothetical protein